MTLAAIRIDTPPRGRLVRSTLFACAALALFWAPTLVARIVTSSRHEPVSFARAPWRAWAFTGAVLRASLTAQAASPGEALTRATTDLQGAPGSVTQEPTAVELLYLPGHDTLRITGPGGVTHAVDPARSLVWLVEGHATPTGPEVPLGLVDFRSGDLVATWTTAHPTAAARGAA